MPSQRFQQLEVRVRDLETAFLPNFHDPLEDYTPVEIDNARAYVLLIYGEFEKYLEDRCSEIVLQALIRWKQSKHVSITIFSLVCCHHSGWKDFSLGRIKELYINAKKRGRPKTAVGDFVNQAQIKYTEIIKDNNGANSETLRNIMMPAGVDVDELESDWRANLDDFASMRGSIAHNGEAGRQVDPQQVKLRVAAILAGFLHIDELLETRLEPSLA